MFFSFSLFAVEIEGKRACTCLDATWLWFGLSFQNDPRAFVLGDFNRPGFPQEFRGLSRAWDMQKQLDSGRVVLHASLLRVLAMLAHDMPKVQVGAIVVYHQSGARCIC